jgi:hypothetical protein
MVKPGFEYMAIVATQGGKTRKYLSYSYNYPNAISLGFG